MRMIKWHNSQAEYGDLYVYGLQNIQMYDKSTIEWKK